MSILKLVKYADENRLSDAADAEFLRSRKMAPDVVLDFADIAEVSVGFLVKLLADESPETIVDRIVNANEAVDAALAQWAEACTETAIPIEKPRRRPKRRLPPKAPFCPPPERAVIKDDRFTPARLFSRLRQALCSYIESAYPLSDPVLVRARRTLLETAANGHLLAQEPYVETTTRYKGALHTYGQIGLPEHIGKLFERLAATPTSNDPDQTVLFPNMYEHQELALKAFLGQGRDIVVATGTGSGKTECFLLPILGSLYDEAVQRPDSFAQPGVRALILYPMNALVNDQLARLRLLFGEPAVAAEFSTVADGRFPRFGMYTGRTPYPGKRKGQRDTERVEPLLKYYLDMAPDLQERLKRLGRYPAKDMAAFYAREEAKRTTVKTGKTKGQERTKHNWPRRLHTTPGDRELLTRHEMVHGVGTLPGHSPDILVTNYSMLEYMLLRPFERPIFDETRKWLASHEKNQLILVVDEAHVYRGAKGAEIAFLLRRLRARLGIHDSPDKLRVVTTSASLGDGEEAMASIRTFAADLTGKTPADFEPIGGMRELPAPAAPATGEEAAMLSSIDLDALGSAFNPEDLASALAPLFDHYDVDVRGKSADDILATLHDTLNGRPYVNQLIQEAAGKAISFPSLADRVVPGHAEKRQAVEALLAVGTLARKKPDSPGLIPTRIHGVFRGLHALYACINPLCSGRQAAAGEQAMLGKLFTTPEISCDACGARVFEMASCRSCGTPYILAYTESGTLDKLDFLWGEMEGNLVRFELLPATPRYPDRTEEMIVHLRTGYLDAEATYPKDEVRSLYICLDGDDKRSVNYDRCVMCQPSGMARSRIFDFRTRGEQPFTALIEAQFAEQPPQNPDLRLPNHGRKVLVFSDGRQKAARLAPALEHSHARDLFRQVMTVATHELKEQTGDTGMIRLYPAMVWLCAERCYDLFPFPDKTTSEADEDSRAVVEFRHQLQRARGRSLTDLLRPASMQHFGSVSLFGKFLFEEMTDRFISLPALGLASVREDSCMSFLFDDFPDSHLDRDALETLFHAWLRLQLERRSFYPGGVGMGQLGEGWAKPRGIQASKEADLLPFQFRQYLLKIFAADEAAVDATCGWLQRVVRESGLLVPQADYYYLSTHGLALDLHLNGSSLRCSDCGRILLESIERICPACCGQLVDADADYLAMTTGFYREQVARAFDERCLEPFGLSAAEHSAQLTAAPDESAFNKVEEYELRFQDIALDGKSPIDILSCTTTMEVGIDIGALSGVALRNVPPHVANYQQRAGRAGRRGRSIASVITYAHGSSHDAHFFDHPEEMIAGDVKAPVVYVENQQVLTRHINAFLIQRFFHEVVPADTNSNAYQLFESLGTVAQFLSESHTCSLDKLKAWLLANETELKEEIRCWVPSYSHGLDKDVAGVDETIDGAVGNFCEAVARVLPMAEYAAMSELPELELEALKQRLGERLLETLINNAVLPRYAFPMDVVSFWVPKPRSIGSVPEPAKFEYSPQRDLQIALSDYAPGRTMTIDKWRFESAAIYSPSDPTPTQTLARRQPYTACRDCTYVSLTQEAMDLLHCPCCDSDQLTRSTFITPSGFAPDVNAPRQPDRGEAITYAGLTDRARLEIQDPPATWDAKFYNDRLCLWTGGQRLAVVNKGVGERGFRVCPQCGRSEPEYGPGYTATKLTKAGTPVSHGHPLEAGTTCTGVAAGPFYLGHRFPTDVLLMRVTTDGAVRLGMPGTPGLLSRAARMAMTSLVEAMALAASRDLQIEEGELSGWWAPVLGRKVDQAQLYLYDLLPGGAGYAKAVGERIEGVLDATDRLLDGCDCATSCYRCIRHYGNNYIHASLDRNLALALLRHIRTGMVPEIDRDQKLSLLAGVRECLDLRNVSFEESAARGGVVIPLIVYGANGEIWTDVHHPLVNPALAFTEVAQAAQVNFHELVEMDAFSLKHDLPSAMAKFKLPGPNGESA